MSKAPVPYAHRAPCVGVGPGTTSVCALVAQPDLRHTAACHQRFAESLVQGFLDDFLETQAAQYRAATHSLWGPAPAHLGGFLTPAGLGEWRREVAREAAPKVDDWCRELDIQAPRPLTTFSYSVRALYRILGPDGILRQPSRLPCNRPFLWPYHRRVQAGQWSDTETESPYDGDSPPGR